jgi:hypothetical protein
MSTAQKNVDQNEAPIAASNSVSAAHPLSILLETFKLAVPHDAIDSGLDPTSPIYRSFRHLPSPLVKLLRSSNLSGLFVVDPQACNDQSVSESADGEQASKRRRTVSQFTADDVFVQNDVAVESTSASFYLTDSPPLFNSNNESLITCSSLLTPRALFLPDDDCDFIAHRMQ